MPRTDTLQRLGGIFRQALNPRHWSTRNRQEPERVLQWVKSVRYGPNAHKLSAEWVKEILRHPSWACPLSEYWVWAPWRPLHDHIQYDQEEIEQWMMTAQRPKACEEGMAALLGRDNPDVGLDIVEKVWMAVTRMAEQPDVSLHVFSETYRPFFWKTRLAFPIWTEIFPHEVTWQPKWCSHCGMPVNDLQNNLRSTCWICHSREKSQRLQHHIQQVTEAVPRSYYLP